MKTVLKGVVFSSIMIFMFCGGCGPANNSPENIILISIDTLRPDHIGCYGYPRDTTPAMDEIATKGVLFLDASATSPWTLPSHATLLTGLYPSGHGVKEPVKRLSDEIPSLATLLAAKGFNTMAIVNSHHLSSRYGLDQGFESFEYISEWSAHKGPARRIVNRGEEITFKGIKRLKQRDHRPFFLFLHYYDTHTDLTPKPKYRKKFVRPYSGQITGLTPQLASMRAQKYPLSEEDIRFLNDLYDAEIRQLDDALFKLFRYLDESDLEENTLVVISSDHGEEFMEHGSILHGRTYYQEVIGIPLILRGPGIPRGIRIKEPVSLVDIAPTIMDLLGHAVYEKSQGVSLQSLWSDEGGDSKSRPLFAEADWMLEEPDLFRMVRHNNFKLFYNRLTRETKLYDLKKDPTEMHDLSEKENKISYALLQQIKDFMSREVSGETIEPPTEEELERLRRLGYVR